METLQERIAKVMEATGYTVGRIAEIAGVSSSAVTQWKDGPTKSLKTEPATLLAQASGFNALWISTGAGPMRPSGAVPAVVQPPTLGEALEVVARCLNDLPDSAREQAAQHLQTLARAPDSQKALAALIQAMAATDLSATPTAHHLLSAAASVESSALPRPALPKP